MGTTSLAASAVLAMSTVASAELLRYTASGGLISGRLYGLGGPEFSGATWSLTGIANSASRVELPVTGGFFTFGIPVTPTLTINYGVWSWTMTLRNEIDSGSGQSLDWFVYATQSSDPARSEAGLMRWHPNLGYGYGAGTSFDLPQLSLMQPANVVAPFSFFSTTRFRSVEDVPIDIFGYTGGPGSFRIEAVPSPAGFVVAIGATLMRTRRRRI